MVGVVFEKLIGDFQAFSIYFLIVQALKIQVYDYVKVKFFFRLTSISWNWRRSRAVNASVALLLNMYTIFKIKETD